LKRHKASNATYSFESLAHRETKKTFFWTRMMLLRKADIDDNFASVAQERLRSLIDICSAKLGEIQEIGNGEREEESGLSEGVGVDPDPISEATGTRETETEDEGTQTDSAEK
jgi:hypothetical protein